MDINIEDEYVIIDSDNQNYSDRFDHSATVVNTFQFNNVKSIYDTNKEYVMIFDIKDYLLKIWESYDKNSIKIWEQFCLDFPRMDYIFNGLNMTSPHDFLI